MNSSFCIPLSLPKMVLLPLALVVIAFSCGCLKTEHDLRIKEDGTAEYRLDYSISEQAIVQLRAMEKLKQQLAEASGMPAPANTLHPLLAAFLDPDETTIREAITAYKDDGIALKNLDVESRAAWRNVKLQIEVKDLKKAAQTDFFKAHGFDLNRDDAGRYVFWREPHINKPGEIPKAPSEAELRDLIPIVSGFNTTVNVTVPGRIYASTAFRSTLNTATWIFDFDREPAAIQTLQHQPFRIVFDSQNANLPELHYNGSKVTK
jgi:hypothetical protein